MTTPTPNPTDEYRDRLAQRKASLAEVVRRNSLWANARGMSFLAAVAVAVMAFRSPAVPFVWILPPVVVFIALVVIHRRGQAEQKRLGQAVAFYQRGLRRLDDRWQEDGTEGSRYMTDGHLFAADLDLFGKGSLLQLLCTAQTRMGEDTLAAWLREPASPPEILARQRAVRELRDQIDLGEQLAVLPKEVHDSISPSVLRAWIQKKSTLSGSLHVPGCLVLSTAFSIALAFHLWGTISFGLPGLLFLVEGVYLVFLWKRILAVGRIADNMSRHLRFLSRVLEVLETQSFESEKLRDLSSRLKTDGRPPSKQIARLHRMIDSLDTVTRNMAVVPFSVGLMLPLHVARAMEQWRATVGRSAIDWLTVVGEYEALLALAGHAFERPEHAFPTIEKTGPIFDAERLGHPLLPKKACVPNDLRLDKDRPMLLISGSNMSGKSTMLRSVGVNLVLAQAGSVVRAKRMTVSPLAIGASINIRDSLQEGQSHFYAEMARLREIVALLDGDRPALFLLDEIMHGTNSRDRRIGSEAVLRKLIDEGAIGLITTHDLALTEIVVDLKDRADNAHFEDQLVDGRMAFDYRMRPGVVQKSNALSVMRSLGLDV